MRKTTPEKGAKGSKTGPAAGKRVRPATKSVRFGDDLTDQLQAMADERNMSVSAVVRTAVEMYLQREEFSVALGDMEEKIARTINAGRKDTIRVADDIQMVIAILDKFINFSMIVTPEVIDKKAATALGTMRYNNFIADLHKAFHSRKKKAVLTQTLDQMESEE